MRSRTVSVLLLGALWVTPALAQQAPTAAAPTAAPAAAAPAATAPTASGTPTSQGVSEALGDQGLKRFFEFTDFEHGLTAEQVAQRAVANSALVDQRKANAALADAQVDEASSRLWPKLTFSGRYSRLSPVNSQLGTNIVTSPQQGRLNTATDQLNASPLAFPSLVNQWELKATLSVPVSDYLYRTGKAISAADHSAQSAKFSEEAAKRDVAANAKLAYYDWVQAIGQQIVAEEGLANFQAREKDAKVFYQAGSLPKAQLLGAQAQTKNAEVLATRARHFAVVAQERLKTITYDPNPNASYKVGEDLRMPVKPAGSLDNTEDLVLQAQANRTEFKTLSEKEQSTEKLKSLAKTEAYPRFDVTGNAYYANPNQRYFPQQEKWNGSWDVNAVLSWTPTDIAHSNAVASQQQAQIDELHAERKQLVESLRLEVTQAAQAVEEADATLLSAQEALAAAEESYRGRRELFRIGQGSLVDLNDAEVALTRARLEVINAHIDARTSRVRLDHALGRDPVPPSDDD